MLFKISYWEKGYTQTTTLEGAFPCLKQSRANVDSFRFQPLPSVWEVFLRHLSRAKGQTRCELMDMGKKEGKEEAVKILELS